MKYSDSIYVVGGKDNLFEYPLNSCTMDECVSYLQSIDLIGVDTETEGFDFTGKKLLMIQCGDKEKQFVIDYRVTSKEDMAKLKTVLEDASKTKILTMLSSITSSSNSIVISVSIMCTTHS